MKLQNINNERNETFQEFQQKFDTIFNFDVISTIRLKKYHQITRSFGKYVQTSVGNQSEFQNFNSARYINQVSVFKSDRNGLSNRKC